VRAAAFTFTPCADSALSNSVPIFPVEPITKIMSLSLFPQLDRGREAHATPPTPRPSRRDRIGNFLGLGGFRAAALRGTIMSSYYLSEDLARFGEMSKASPKLYDQFMKWYGATMEKGALDAKTKKLLALAVAFAIQEPYCIDSYASACADAGWSPEEMAEAVNVAAAIRGGGAIAHWVQACNTMARKG
jgi:alkylhydroperoxidase/carboxymuconolactone decarboxylase family protein